MKTRHTPRLQALDITRGLAVAAMIVVNNPGNWNAVHGQLAHSAWNGVTCADLVFPAFVFIMGVSVALADADGDRQPTWRAFARRTLERSATMILLGLAVNAVKAWPQIDRLRVPGVLQRIGITYLIAVVTLRLTAGRQRSLWMIAFTLLTLHWWLLVDAPWAHTPLSPHTNSAALVDRWLFGTHLLSASGDPEGSLGVVSSVATALIGVSLGLRLRAQTGAPAGATPRSAHTDLATAGISLLAVGYAWSFMLPFNKFLWTGSFAVFSAGAAALALSVGMLLVQRTGTWALRPFEWLGTNALAIYCLSEVIASLAERPWLRLGTQTVAAKDLLFWQGLAPYVGDLGGEASSALYAVSYATIWCGVAAFMRRRGLRFRA